MTTRARPPRWSGVHDAKLLGAVVRLTKLGDTEIDWTEVAKDVAPRTPAQCERRLRKLRPVAERQRAATRAQIRDAETLLDMHARAAQDALDAEAFFQAAMAPYAPPAVAPPPKNNRITFRTVKTVSQPVTHPLSSHHFVLAAAPRRPLHFEFKKKPPPPQPRVLVPQRLTFPLMCATPFARATPPRTVPACAKFSAQ